MINTGNRGRRSRQILASSAPVMPGISWSVTSTSISCPLSSRARAWAALAVVAAVHTYSYPTQKLFTPLWLGASVCALSFPRWKQGAAALLAYALLVSPLFILALRDPERYNARFNSVALDFHRPGVVWKVLQRYGGYWLSDFHFGRGDTDLMHHVPGSGAMYPIIALLFWVGVLAVGAHGLGFRVAPLEMSRRLALVLLAWLVLFPIAGSLTRDQMHLLRAVHGLPAVIVFASVGLDVICRSMTASSVQNLVLGALAFVMTIECAVFTVDYWGSYRRGSRDAFQYGMRPVIERALALQDGYERVRFTEHANQAYVFYLFVSQKDPRTLNYDDVRRRVIDKWDFRGFRDAEVRGAEELYAVKADGHVWRRLLAKGSTLYVL